MRFAQSVYGRSEPGERFKMVLRAVRLDGRQHGSPGRRTERIPEKTNTTLTSPDFTPSQEAALEEIKGLLGGIDALKKQRPRCRIRDTGSPYSRWFDNSWSLAHRRRT
jgi:hypothetical protein